MRQSTNAPIRMMGSLAPSVKARPANAATGAFAWFKVRT
jgi:hypothetical protein